jgi:voltage-gated sodium channel
MFQSVARGAARIAGSAGFQITVVVLIIVNAILLGLETYDDIDSRYGDELGRLNEVFLALFTVEILIRIAAYGAHPLRYFRSGWNIFDFVVVFSAYLPFVRESVTLLRIVRLLRVTRVLSVLPGLRVVMYGMLRSIPPLTSVGVLIFFLLYVYAMLGWAWFGDYDPENFGDVGRALLTLFQLLTLEGWNEVLDTTMEYTSWAWVYFVSFILIGSFLVLNVVIAIVLNSVDEAREEEQRRRRLQRAAAAGIEGGAGSRHGDLIEERLAELRQAFEALEVELAREPDVDGRDAARRVLRDMADEIRPRS